MAIRLKSRQNEAVGQLLRRFKKLCEKEGLTRDVKRKQFFEKPSERKRRAERKSAARILRLRMDAESGGRSSGGRPPGGSSQGGRPSGGRPSGGRPSGGRPSSGR